MKVSKHLGYLKTHGLVSVRKEGNWRVYALVAKQPKVLKTNLACLQDCVADDKGLRRDLVKLKAVRACIGDEGPDCCAKR